VGAGRAAGGHGRADDMQQEPITDTAIGAPLSVQAPHECRPHSPMQHLEYLYISAYGSTYIQWLLAYACNPLPSNLLQHVNAQLSRLPPQQQPDMGIPALLPAGITKDDLDGEASTRKAVQKRLRALLGPDAVLVGHSLHHDLRSLRLDHCHVIDTSLLFRFKGRHAHAASLAATASGNAPNS
jgi:hypothetical protein